MVGYIIQSQGTRQHLIPDLWGVVKPEGPNIGAPHAHFSTPTKMRSTEITSAMLQPLVLRTQGKGTLTSVPRWPSLFFDQSLALAKLLAKRFDFGPVTIPVSNVDLGLDTVYMIVRCFVV